jgi:hypothetical protein
VTGVNDDRTQRYAEAVENAVLPVRVRQVMAVADTELADLRAELDEQLDDSGLTALYASEGLDIWRERAKAAEAKVARVEARVAEWWSCGPRQQSTRDVLKSIEAALDGDQP